MQVRREVPCPNPRHEHDQPQEERYADLPFFDQFRIPAGKPYEFLSDPTASTYKVERHLAKEDRFVIRVTGDSMSPRIEDGDLILVDYAKQPRPGNTVVASFNGGVAVKKYLRQEGRAVLESLNPQHADIEIKETDQFEIKFRSALSKILRRWPLRARSISRTMRTGL